MTDPFQRDLLRGSLDLMILSVLSDGPKYGYLIQKQIRVATGDRVPLPAGTLYPILHRLEHEQLVRADWNDETGRRRKWYRVTPAGRSRLRQQAHEWTEYVECIQRLLAALGDAVLRPNVSRS